MGKWTRRSVLGGVAGAGVGSAFAAFGGGSDGNQQSLHGGTMALDQAFNVAGDLWIGPDSAKGTVDATSGRVYTAVDTQLEYYGDGEEWVKMGIGSADAPVPEAYAESVSTEAASANLSQSSHDWIIYEDEGVYKARSATTAAVEYESAELHEVMNSAILEGNSIKIKGQSHTLSGPIEIPVGGISIWGHSLRGTRSTKLIADGDFPVFKVNTPDIFDSEGHGHIHGVTIGDMQLEGTYDDTDENNHGVYFGNASDCQLIRMYIWRFGGNAVRVEPVDQGDTSRSLDSQYYGVITEGCGKAGWLFKSTEDTRIERHFVNSGYSYANEYGFVYEGRNTTQQFVCNYFTSNNKQYGLVIQNQGGCYVGGGIYSNGQDESGDQTNVLVDHDDAGYGGGSWLLAPSWRGRRSGGDKYHVRFNNTTSSRGSVFVGNMQGVDEVVHPDSTSSVYNQRNDFSAVYGYETEAHDTYTTSGDGSTTTFRIPHGISSIGHSSDVDYASTTPMSDDAMGDYKLVGVDEDNIEIDYDSAPPDGTDNLAWGWSISLDTGRGAHGRGL